MGTGTRPLGTGWKSKGQRRNVLDSDGLSLVGCVITELSWATLVSLKVVGVSPGGSVMDPSLSLSRRPSPHA